MSQTVNLFDSSGSTEALFAEGKAALESIVGVMPNGSYSAGHVHFGGFKREATGMAAFNRSTLATVAKDAAWLEGTTPIADVIATDLAGLIGGSAGRAAVLLISDGRATDYAGREGMGDGAVASALALAKGRSGETCFHTIQTGDDPTGAATLQAIANVSTCGSFRNVSTLASASALQQFSRDVYLGAGPAPAPLATAPGDADGDGVLDPNDACPNTLRGARVDGRGCWTLQGLRFAGEQCGHRSPVHDDAAGRDCGAEGESRCEGQHRWSHGFGRLRRLQPVALRASGGERAEILRDDR